MDRRAFLGALAGLPVAGSLEGFCSVEQKEDGRAFSLGGSLRTDESRLHVFMHQPVRKFFCTTMRDIEIDYKQLVYRKWKKKKLYYVAGEVKAKLSASDMH